MILRLWFDSADDAPDLVRLSKLGTVETAGADRRGVWMPYPGAEDGKERYCVALHLLSHMSQAAVQTALDFAGVRADLDARDYAGLRRSGHL